MFLFLLQVVAGTEDAVCISGWISGAYEDRLHVEVQALNLHWEDEMHYDA